MKPSLAVVPRDKTPPNIISTEEAVKNFARWLEAKTWSIDYSSTGVVSAFQASSNRTHNIEIIKKKFIEWAFLMNVRVSEDEYADFLKNLVSQVTHRLPDIVGSSFRPVPDAIINVHGANLANTYVPFKPEVPDVFEMPEILNEYLERVLRNERDRKYVTQFCADIIQNPLRRPQWGIMLTGEQGTGKSTIFELVRAALGGHHVADLNDYEPALARFSEIFPDNLLVVFDDATASAKTYQSLKAAMTRKTQNVELKNIQRRVQREVFARVMVCSNSPRPLILEPNDRRFYVADWIPHQENTKDTASFFVEFNKWLEEPSTPATLYHWLSTVDLSDFVHGSTIQTENHANMVDLSSSVLDSLLAEYVAQSPIFHENSLFAYLAENKITHPNPDRIKMAMATLKYVKKRRKVDGCSEKQLPLWQPVANRSRPLLPHEIDSIRRAVTLDF